MHAHDERIGQHDAFAGAYAPAEVASYLRSSEPIEKVAPSPQRLRSWAHHHVLSPHEPVKSHGRISLSFSDLTTSQVVAILLAKDWSLRRIRAAEKTFAQLLGVKRPFTNRALWTAGPDLFARVEGALVAGTRGGQIAMEELVADWLRPVGRHFGFDDMTGQAVSWRPVPFVELNPRVQFGAPCVQGTSIPTSALWSYVAGGDRVEYVARVYGLAVTAVERAVTWEDRRRHALAASATVSA